MVGAVVAGGVWCRKVCPAVAVDRHGQVVFAEGNDAAAEPADGPLAPPAFLELQADEDAQPEDQVADLLVRLLVLRQCRQVVDRRHQGVDLFLWPRACGSVNLRRGHFCDLACDRRLLCHELVKRLGDGLVANLILLGGHPPLRGRDVILESCQLLAQVQEGGRFRGLGVLLGFRSSLCQKPFADGLTAPGLLDELDERVDEHGRDRRGLDRVVAALGVAAVVVAAAGVLQLVADRDAVHHAAAALGKVDDPS